MLIVDELVKSYGGTRRRRGGAADGRPERVFAVDGASFEVHEGELFTLLGPSGCGKTTTLRSIAGPGEPRRRPDHPGRPAAVRRRREARQCPGEPARARHGLPVLRDLAAHDRLQERRRSRSTCCRARDRPKRAEIVERVERALEVTELGELRRPGRHQAVRWPAATARAGPGPGDPARADAAGRAAVQPGRQAAGDDALRAQAAPARARVDRDLRDPRPVRGAGDVEPDRGDERRADRAGGQAARDLHPPGVAVRGRVHRHHPTSSPAWSPRPPRTRW